MADRPYRSLKAKDGTWKLKFPMNSVIAFEDESGASINEFGSKLEAGSFSIKEIRMLLWAALLHHHEDVTITQAGDIADKAGGFRKIMDPLMGAFQDAFPADEAENAEGEEGDTPNESSATEDS